MSWTAWWLVCASLILVSLPGSRALPRVRRAVNGPCDKLDLMFMMDASNSVSGTEMLAIRTFVGEVTKQVSVSQSETRVSVGSFGGTASRANELSELNNYSDLTTALGGISHQNDQADMALALAVARGGYSTTLDERADVHNVLVVLSASEPSNDTAAQYSWLLHESGAQIIVVGIGSGVSQGVLGQVASNPTTDYLSITSTNGLDTAFIEKLTQKLCDAAKIDECSSNPCQNGGVCNDLPGRYECDCDPDYGGDQCQYVCGPIDLGLVLDASGSVTKDNWDDNVNPFVLELIDNLPIGEKKVRIGSVTYSSDAEVDFYLNSHYDKQAMKNAVLANEYYSSSTNTASGIRTLREEIFSTVGDESFGDRVGVKNFAMIYTDGYSNRNDTGTIPSGQLLFSSGAADAVYCLGVSQGVDINEIKGIADQDAHALLALDFAAMSTFITLLKGAICAGSSPPCDVKPCNPSGTTTCENVGANYKCVCKIGYRGQHCDQQQQCFDVDFGWVVDSSLSITAPNWDLVNDFVNMSNAQPVMDIAPDKTLIGRVDYSLEAGVEYKLDAYFDKAALMSAPDPAFRAKLTFTHLGLKEAYNTLLDPVNGERPLHPNMVTLLTDGTSTFPADTETEAAQLRAVADVYAIGVKGYDPFELLKIVNNDNSKILVAADFPDLDANAVAMFIDGICGNRTNAPCDDTSKCKNGGSCLNTVSGGFVCVCPPGFSGPNCDDATVCTEMDLVYILDESTSVTQANWDIMTGELTATVDPQLVRPGYVQVGVVEYGAFADTTIQLDQYPYGADLQDATSQLVYSYGLTFTDLGIKTMMDDTLMPGNGQRDGVPKVGFILTDGNSNDRSKSVAQADLARAAGIDLYVVGIGFAQSTSLDATELVEIAGDAKKVVLTPGYADIKPALEHSYKVLCGFDPLDPCAASPCKNGATCVATVAGSGGSTVTSHTCLCLPGFKGPTCDIKRCDQLDVTFVLEDTFYIKDPDFSTMIAGIKDVVGPNLLNVDSSSSQVRVVTYGGDKTVELLPWTGQNVGAALDVPARASNIFLKSMPVGIQSGIDGYTAPGADPDNEKIMVVVYDQYTVYPGKIEAKAKEAIAAGMEVYALGIRALFPHSVVAVAAGDKDKALLAKDYGEVKDALNLLMGGICGDPAVFVPCDGVDCGGNGYCVPGVGTYQCACDPGYGGKNCDQQNDCYKADVAYVVDSSGSVGIYWNTLLEFVAASTRNLDVRAGGANVGMVSYGWFHRAEFGYDANLDHGDLADDIMDTAFDRGLTRTGEGINDMTTILNTAAMGDRPNNPNYGIIITDGKSSYPMNTLARAAEARLTTELFAIGVRDYDMAELYEVVGGGSNNDKIILVDDFPDLIYAEKWLQEMTCGLEKTGDPCANSPCNNGGVCLPKVGPTSSFKCLCQGGYTGPTCDSLPTTCEEADICIVYDSSMLTTDTRWASLKSFTNNLIAKRTSGGNSIYAGIISYSSSASLVKDMSLATGYTLQDSNRPTAGSTSQNSVGLDAALSQCHKGMGARSGVRKTTLLITNTASTDLSAATTSAQALKDFGSEVFVVATNVAAKSEAEQLADSTSAVLVLATPEDIGFKATAVSNMFCGLPLPDGKCHGKDICFLLDTSASLDDTMWGKQCDFVEQATKDQPIGSGDDDVEIGLLEFGFFTYLINNCGQGSNKAAVMDKISTALRPGHKRQLTYVGKAFNEGRATCFTGGNPNHDKVFILVTDGVASDAADALTAAETAKSEGIDIWSIGVNSLVDPSDLEKYASTKNQFLAPSDYDTLVSQYSDIMAMICG